MVNSLRKVDFFAPYWPLYMEKIRPPLRKSWVPLAVRRCYEYVVDWGWKGWLEVAGVARLVITEAKVTMD